MKEHTQIFLFCKCFVPNKDTLGVFWHKKVPQRLVQYALLTTTTHHSSSKELYIFLLYKITKSLSWAVSECRVHDWPNLVMIPLRRKKLNTLSLEIKAFCLMKCSSEILQKFKIYFWNTKTYAFFFIFMEFFLEHCIKHKPSIYEERTVQSVWKKSWFDVVDLNL